jgi:hypothetical protein
MNHRAHREHRDDLRFEIVKSISQQIFQSAICNQQSEIATLCALYGLCGKDQRGKWRM